MSMSNDEITTSSSTAPQMLPDAVMVPNQRYCAISFLQARPDDPKKRFAIKVSGCFDSADEARAHVKRLMEVDSSYDIYLMDTGRWHMAPPDPNDTNTQRDYSIANRSELQELWDGHQDNRERVQAFEKRRQELVRQGKLDPAAPERTVHASIAKSVGDGDDDEEDEDGEDTTPAMGSRITTMVNDKNNNIPLDDVPGHIDELAAIDRELGACAMSSSGVLS